MTSSRRTLLQLSALVGVGAAIRWQLDPTGGILFGASRALAAVQVTQTPLAGSSVKKFVQPLPTFVGQRVTSTSVNVGMFEFQQNILPDPMYSGLPAPFNGGSFVWGYSVQGTDTQAPTTPNAAQPSSSLGGRSRR
ncbi:MAG: hypothetical protein JOZ81_25905 [Chloroflexi bacterium]|nr:hypothetical protein [Chloroflexota bacterium]